MPLKKIVKDIFSIRKDNEIIELSKDTYIPSISPYQNKNFKIIANNCWGAENYKRAQIPYNTPFVGLYIYGPDYVDLLKDFPQCMQQSLKFSQTSQWRKDGVSYPIGYLSGNIEIHFLHYKTQQEALEKWNRRSERLLENFQIDDCYFKFCDRDAAKVEDLRAFHQLPFKNKISFGRQPLDGENAHIMIKEDDNGTVPDGIKLFNLSNKYVDIPHWINTGDIIVKI